MDREHSPRVVVKSMLDDVKPVLPSSTEKSELFACHLRWVAGVASFRLPRSRQAFDFDEANRRSSRRGSGLDVETGIVRGHLLGRTAVLLLVLKDTFVTLPRDLRPEPRSGLKPATLHPSINR